jgi:hypothetical protein
MQRAITSTALGLVLGTVALFLGGVLSWGYYSASPVDRVSAMLFSWPFFAAGAILPATAVGADLVVGLIFNYSFYILVAWLLLGLRRAVLESLAR